MSSLLVTALWLTVSACSEVDAPEGVFPCVDPGQCPTSWLCAARGGVERRCWKPTTIDGGGFVVSNEPPPQKGPPNPNSSNVDAGAFPCGRWQRMSYSDEIPANAQVLGSEATTGEPGKNYVCSFSFRQGETEIRLQGRLAARYGCHAASPQGPNRLSAPQVAASFDVLVGTEGCVNVGPPGPDFFPLPTGTSIEGKPTFSCIAELPSKTVPGAMNTMLGRLDETFGSCFFVNEKSLVETSSNFKLLLGTGTSPVVLDAAP